MHLTQVAPTCRVRGGGRLPPYGRRVRSALRHRGGVPSLPGPGSLAGRLSLPGLRRRHRVACSNGAPAMRRVWPTDLGDRRHRVSGHANAADDVVSGDVVCEQLEDGDQCSGPAAGVGPGQLPNRLGLAPQTAARHGQTGTGSVVRPRGSGRKFCGWSRGSRGTLDGHQSAHRRGRRGRWARDGACPHAPYPPMVRPTASGPSSRRPSSPAVWCTPTAGMGTTA